MDKILQAAAPPAARRARVPDTRILRCPNREIVDADLSVSDGEVPLTGMVIKSAREVPARRE